MDSRRDRGIRIAIDVRCCYVNIYATLLILFRGEVRSQTAWGIQAVER